MQLVKNWKKFRDEECCSCGDVTLVQVWLFSPGGDLELLGIRDVIRRRNGISRKFRAEPGFGMGRKVTQ